MYSFSVSKLMTVFIFLVSFLFSSIAFSEEKANNCSDASDRLSLILREANSKELTARIDSKVVTLGDSCERKVDWGEYKDSSGNLIKGEALKNAQEAFDSATFNIIGKDLDNEQVESCNEAKKDFKEAESDSDEACGDAQLSCEKEFNECGDALEELSDGGSLDVAFDDCGSLAKEDFKELKETYDDNQKTILELTTQISEEQGNITQARNDYQTLKEELNEAFKQVELAITELESSSQAAYENLGTDILLKKQEREKQIQTLEDGIDDLVFELEASRQNVFFEKRQLENTCWTFAETRLSEIVACQQTARVQEISTGAKATARCKTNLSSRQFVNGSAKTKAKRLMQQMEILQDQCSRGQKNKNAQQDIKQKYINDRNRISSQLNKLKIELSNAINSKIIGNNKDENDKLAMVRTFEIERAKLERKKAQLKNKLIAAERNTTNAINLSNAKLNELRGSQAALAASFQQTSEIYKAASSKARGSSTKGGAVAKALAKYKKTLRAALTVAEECGCSKLCGSNNKKGCGPANKVIADNFEYLDELGASCGDEETTSSSSSSSTTTGSAP